LDIYTYTYKDGFVYNKHKDYKNSGSTTTKHGSMSFTHGRKPLKFHDGFLLGLNAVP